MEYRNKKTTLRNKDNKNNSNETQRKWRIGKITCSNVTFAKMAAMD